MAHGAAQNLPELSQLPSQPDLPDPLVMFNGQRVTSKEQWIEQRRPELKQLFQHYMYGYLPPAPKPYHAKVIFENKNAFNGKANLREVQIAYGPEETPPLYLLVVVQRNGCKVSLAISIISTLTFWAIFELGLTLRLPAGLLDLLR
jgi:hypothetical protein